MSDNNNDLNNSKKKITQEDIQMVRRGRWHVFVAGISINILIGSFYSFGAFSIYLSSYQKANEYQVTQDSVAILFPFMQLIMLKSRQYGEYAIQNFGIKSTIFLCTLFLSASFVMISLLPKYYFVAFLFLAIVSPSFGILSSIPYHTTSKLFPQNQEKIKEVLAASYGIGAALFTYFSFELVNHLNEYPKRMEFERGIKINYFEECISYNTPIMLQFFAAAYSAFGLLAILLLNSYPEENIISQYGLFESVQSKLTEQKVEDKQKIIKQTLPDFNNNRAKNIIYSKLFQKCSYLAFVTSCKLQEFYFQKSRNQLPENFKNIFEFSMPDLDNFLINQLMGFI